MALTKVSRGLLSTGIVDNSNATAITLNADESATFAGGVDVTGASTLTGAVGINIAPTSYKLTVNSGATTETTAAAFGYNGDAGTNLYVNTDHGNNLVSLYASGSASKEMRFLSGTLEVMRLGTTGNVGIGITPATLLDIKESTAATDAIIGLTAGTGGRAQIRSEAQADNTSSELSFYTMSGSNTSEAMRISGSNVGIGVSSPQRVLVLGKGDSTGVQTQYTNSTTGAALGDGFTVGIDGSENAEFWNFENTNMLFATNGTERLRITSAGKLVVNGTVAGYSGADITVGSPSQAASGLSILSSTTGYGYLLFGDVIGDGTGGYSGQINYAHSTNRMGFNTNNVERMAIDSNGALLVGSTGTTLGGSAVVAAGVQSSHTNGAQTMTVYNSSGSCGANGILLVGTARTANTAFDIFNCWTAGVVDKEFKVRGDGNVFADGSFSGGGADYAEFFEWLDGNSSAEDRRGYSVVLDSGKIRVATSEDDASQIIGVISANPAMIGDNDMERWRGKYLRDDFGAYDLNENGDKQLNPDYDEAQPYVPREERVEWDIVGLMGKLRICKGQPTGSNWIKIKDISAGIEEWLVR